MTSAAWESPLSKCACHGFRELLAHIEYSLGQRKYFSAYAGNFRKKEYAKIAPGKTLLGIGACVVALTLFLNAKLLLTLF